MFPCRFLEGIDFTTEHIFSFFPGGEKTNGRCSFPLRAICETRKTRRAFFGSGWQERPLERLVRRSLGGERGKVADLHGPGKGTRVVSGAFCFLFGGEGFPLNSTMLLPNRFYFMLSPSPLWDGLIFSFGQDVGSTHSNWGGWGLEQCGETNRERMPFFSPGHWACQAADSTPSALLV